MTRDPRRAYRVVDQFETELCDYTGAPFAVTVDSCTNALFLSLTFVKEGLPPTKRWSERIITLPTRTYVGVLQAALNAAYRVEWDPEPWKDWYQILPTPIVDSARFIHRGMYPIVREFIPGALVCLSFHAAKQLPLGRGGAILTDDPKGAEWLRAARMDGRPPGAPITETRFPGFHCPMPPDTAARGLWILSRWNDAGYSPPPFADETYPDLSLLHSSIGRPSRHR